MEKPRKRQVTVNFEKTVKKILAIDESMRFLGISDKNGDLIYSKMKEKKIPHYDENQSGQISHDLLILRDMQGMLDDKFGETYWIHVARKNIHLFILYLKARIVYISCEANIEDHKVTDIFLKIRSIIKTIS
jgi:hypothetical protein